MLGDGERATGLEVKVDRCHDQGDSDGERPQDGQICDDEREQRRSSRTRTGERRRARFEKGDEGRPRYTANEGKSDPRSDRHDTKLLSLPRGPREGMCGVVDLHEVLHRHMRVPLRGR